MNKKYSRKEFTRRIALASILPAVIPGRSEGSAGIKFPQALVRECGYRGFLPLETLGEGDPRLKVEALLRKVQDVLHI